MVCAHAFVLYRDSQSFWSFSLPSLPPPQSPFIICEDADIDRAVYDAHHALFMNHGQCCAAGSRLFVHERIYDEFVAKSVACAQKKTVGDPFHKDSEQGPQVSLEQLDRILHYVGLGQKDGATLETGGARIGTKGYFMEPTVFSGVEDHHTIANEEIFGYVDGCGWLRVLAEKC